jgi:hypothetical protein
MLSILLSLSCLLAGFHLPSISYCPFEQELKGTYLYSHLNLSYLFPSIWKLGNLACFREIRRYNSFHTRLHNSAVVNVQNSCTLLARLHACIPYTYISSCIPIYRYRKLKGLQLYKYWEILSKMGFLYSNKIGDDWFNIIGIPHNVVPIITMDIR